MVDRDLPNQYCLSKTSIQYELYAWQALETLVRLNRAIAGFASNSDRFAGLPRVDDLMLVNFSKTASAEEDAEMQESGEGKSGGN